MVAEQFESVLDAHVANYPTASAEAHQLLDQVTVREAPHPSRRGGIEKLSAHLASYLAGGYDAEPGEQPDFVKRFYATMWATGRQGSRPSNGAQTLMNLDWTIQIPNGLEIGSLSASLLTEILTRRSSRSNLSNATAFGIDGSH